MRRAASHETALSLVSKPLFLDLPEIARDAHRALEHLLRDRLLRLEDRSERRFLRPARRFLLELDRLIAELLAGIDIPGRGLLHTVEVERLAQLGKRVKHFLTIQLIAHLSSFFACTSYRLSRS